MIRGFLVFIFFISTIFATELTYPTANTKIPITFDIQGESIVFKNLPKKYTLLEYFGVRCPVCRMEIPHLISMQKDNPRLQVVAIHMQEVSKEALDDFIFEQGINYPIIDFKYAYDFYIYGKKINPNWEGGIPMTIVLNPNGQAIVYFMGIVSEDEIIKSIKDSTGVDINKNYDTNSTNLKE